MKKIVGLLIVVILLVALRLLSFGIGKPFWGHHDWNSAVYSNVASNYNRYGLAAKLGQVTNHDKTNPRSFSYITHYPPLLPILMSFSFTVFGQSETSARMVVVLFSLLLVFSIYKIGCEIYSRFLGIFAAASVLFLPIFLYFGKMPVHDTVVPAISAFSFWLYLKFIKTEDNKYYKYLIISLIFGGFVNWSAFYLAVALFVHQIIFRSKPEIRKRIFLLVPVSIVIFAVHMFHVHLLGVKSNKAFDNLLIRINPFLTADLYGFTMTKYIKQELLYLKVYYTWPLFIGSSIFLFGLAIAFLRKKLNLATSFIFCLFVYGAIQVVVFEQLSFIHDYMIYYLLPFMVLATSYIIFMLPKTFKKTFIFPLFLIGILTFSLFSGLKYTQTLLNTSEHKRGYNVAQVILNNTKSGEVSFIGSTSYKEFEEVFVGYYAGRTIDYGDTLPENFENMFKMVIRPKDHDPLDAASKKLLDSTYPKFEDENFIWYKIN